MEKPLRAYARRRREDAGEPVLHPATRRLLQAEAAKLRPRGEARAGSFWGALMARWPRVGLAAAVCVALAVAVWNFLPDGGRSSAPMTMARNVETPTDFLTLGEELAAPARAGAVEPVERKEAEARLAAQSARTKGAAIEPLDRLNERASGFRGLAGEPAARETVKLNQAGTDFDALAGDGLARSDKRLADTRSYFALGSTMTFTNAGSYGVALDGGAQTWHFGTGALGGLMAGKSGDGSDRYYRFGSALYSRSNASGAGDRLSASTASAGRPTSVLFSDDFAQGRTGNASLLAAKQEVMESESLALRYRAPAGTVALGKESALGLATAQPASGPLAAGAKAKAGDAAILSEVAQVQATVAAGSENLFKEAQLAPEANSRPLPLATQLAPPPAPARAVAAPLDVALRPAAAPAPAVPSLTAAPAASFAARSGESGALAASTVRHRFARQSAAVETRVAQKDAAKADGAAAAAEPVLAVFDFEQSGGTVRVIDGDGSIYEGRTITTEFLSDEDSTAGQQSRRFAVRSAAPRQQREEPALVEELQSGTERMAVSTNATFRVSGTNRSSGRLVTFTGSLVSDSSVTNGRSITGVTLERQFRASDVDAGRTAAAPGLRVLGRLRVGLTNETPLFAVPAAK